jgi:hypothetical protein
MNTSGDRVLAEEMNKLEDLTKKPLPIRILDHEKYKSTIQEIFRHVEEATTAFQVCTLILISGCVYAY